MASRIKINRFTPLPELQGGVVIGGVLHNVSATVRISTRTQSRSELSAQPYWYERRGGVNVVLFMSGGHL